MNRATQPSRSGTSRRACLRTLHQIAAVMLVTLGMACAQARGNTEPCLGLVLAGGGARGLAHVGVLRYLEQQRIPVCAIAGTSMGAVIGGLYASGMSASQIEKVVDGLDWRVALGDAIPRDQLSFRRKQDDFDYLVRAKLRFRNRRPQLPQGLVQGQNLNLLLHELVAPVSWVEGFDELPIRYRAVATDIANGQAVVLDSGDLAEAMRASMSIPGLFNPVEREGRLLVDGGIANNVPVDIARAMGAGPLIVVDVSTPLAGKDKLDNVLTVLDQLTTILTLRNAEAQLARLAPEDVLIRPALDAADLGNTDFDRAELAIELGYQAAQAAHAGLAAFRDAEDSAQLAMATTEIRHGAPLIDRIEISNNSRLPDRLLRNKISQKTGKRLDRKQLRLDIGEIYGLHDFSRVDYRVTTESGENVLRVNAVANNTGGGFLKLGLSWESDSRGDSDFALRASWRQKGINARGAEWYTLAQFGAHPSFGTEFYQPLDLEQRLFLDTSYRYQERGINVIENERIVASAHVDEHRVESAVGLHFQNDASLRLGAFASSSNIDVEIGDPAFSSRSGNDAGYLAELIYDTLSEAYFPRSGSRLVARFEKSIEDWGAESGYRAWSSSLQHAFSLSSRNTLLLTARRAGLELDGTSQALTLPAHAYTLGGFLDLSGYTRDSLAGNQLLQANLVFYHRLDSQSVLPLGFPIYAGGSLEAANVWLHSRDVSLDDLRYAGSLFLGVDSPLGPVHFGIGLGEHDQRALYLRIGQLFE